MPRRTDVTAAPRSDGTDAASVATVPVWDIWVRLFHWSLTVAVLFQILSGTTGWQFFDWHRQGGETVLALVLFRLLWGVFGSANARLSELVRSPVAAVRHLADLVRRRVRPERRHNAAGAWAVLALLMLLGVQALSGMCIADEDELIEGAWYGDVSGATSELLYRVHRVNAELLEALVVVHVAMVLVYLLWGRLNLIRPMLTGRMAGPIGETVPTMFRQRWWVGVPLALVAAGTVAFASGRFG